MIVAKALDLTKATMQDIFDFVVLALIQQGKAAMSSSGSCVYRAEDGSRCAAGQIIGDEEYAAKARYSLGVDGEQFVSGNTLETRTVTALIETGDVPSLIEWTKLGTNVTIKPQGTYTLRDDSAGRTEFLRALQNAHDNASGNPSSVNEPKEWLHKFRQGARAVAETYKLDPYMVGYRSGF